MKSAYKKSMEWLRGEIGDLMELVGVLVFCLGIVCFFVDGGAMGGWIGLNIGLGSSPLHVFLIIIPFCLLPGGLMIGLGVLIRGRKSDQDVSQ